VRILYHHRIGSKDGQAVHLEELVDALRQNGVEVSVVGPESFSRASFGHDPKLISALKALFPQPLYELLEIVYNVPVYFRLRRAWKSFRPQIIYERYNLYLLAGIWLKKRHGVPLLLEVNAPLATERAAHGGLGLRKLARTLENWVWRNADFVLPVTHVLAEHVRAAGVAPEKIVVISNAINPSRFSISSSSSNSLREKLNLTGKTILGFTGFVRDWHGLDRVIDWLARPQLRGTHLVVVGEGPAVPDLKAQAARLKISDRVLFVGLVARDAVGQFISMFDIALQPKCVEYCSPLKLFEYMALGKAIVAPDQSNIREVLDSEQSALLFDPDMPETLVTAIGRLTDDGALRERLGKAAYQMIARKGYTWTHNAQLVEELAQKALLSSERESNADRSPRAPATGF
jgi:glycosyltransferase involved in cell wall biosynthesis